MMTAIATSIWISVLDLCLFVQMKCLRMAIQCGNTQELILIMNCNV